MIEDVHQHIHIIFPGTVIDTTQVQTSCLYNGIQGVYAEVHREILLQSVPRHRDDSSSHLHIPVIFVLGRSI